MAQHQRISREAALPSWVPDGVHFYLSHTVEGTSIRALARSAGLHASTVMRQVRRFEARRDDPLVDHALRRLGRSPGFAGAQAGKENRP